MTCLAYAVRSAGVSSPHRALSRSCSAGQVLTDVYSCKTPSGQGHSAEGPTPDSPAGCVTGRLCVHSLVEKTVLHLEIRCCCETSLSREVR